MLRFYLTVDTELSADHFRRHGRGGMEENFDRSITGTTRHGAGGIGRQMDILDAHGHKGVFFVDPMPALVYGTDIIRRIVDPILSRGHDVQLHCHSEWLSWIERSPVGGRTGHNLLDFTLDDQRAILSCARDLLVKAGAPEPVAFRAGNYGANDDTLRALATLGIHYDSSFTPGFAGSFSRITLAPDQLAPIPHLGVIEVPTGAIASAGSRRRHAQLTAMTRWEVADAIAHGVRHGAGSFTLVSHSFELLSRDRMHINRIVTRRFEGMCADIARRSDASMATFRHDPPPVLPDKGKLPPHHALRALHRLSEQLISNQFYGEKRRAAAPAQAGAGDRAHRDPAYS